MRETVIRFGVGSPRSVPATQCRRAPSTGWRIALLLAALGLLTACSGGLGNLNLPFLGEPTPEPPQLTVLVWDEGQVTQRLDEWLIRYDRLHTEVRVILEVAEDDPLAWARRLAPSTEPPTDVPHEGGGPAPVDVVLVDAYRFPDLAQAGLLAPIPGPDGDDMAPNLVDAFRWQGRRYCLPREVRSLALVYHQGLLEKAGASPPTTWDELRRVAEATSDLNTGTFGLIQSPDLSRWLPFLYQAGGQVIGPDGHMALDSPQALQALTFYIELFRENLAGEPGESLSSWAGEVLGKNRGAMAVEGPWVAPYFATEFPELSYGVARLPRGPAGHRGTVAFTSCWALATASPHPEAAAGLIRALNTPETFAELLGGPGWLPPTQTGQAEWAATYPHLAAFVQELETARVWQFPPGFDPVVRAFNRGMRELFAASIEPEDLLAEVQRIGEEILSASR